VPDYPATVARVVDEPLTFTAPSATLRIDDHPEAVCAVTVRHPRYHRTQLHHIWPKGWGGPDDGELVPLCGLHHDDVHDLLDLFRKAGGPAKVNRRSYSPDVQTLAINGWGRAHPG
jgi:hypothetical protein